MPLFALPAVPVVAKFVFSVATSVFIASVPSYFEEKSSNGLRFNVTRLNESLDSQVFGQHLVLQLVPTMFKNHISHQPSKALVLSFHGWTGTGKTYVSRLLAEHLFDKGMENPFVHYFVASQHFPDPDWVGPYKEQLRTWIKGNITRYNRTLFIFDEVDQMPARLIDVIKPFVDGGDSRGAAFIILSRTGAKAIIRHMVNHWLNGGKREDLQHKDLQHVLKKDASEFGGGLHHSELIKSDLVSAFVPFLPLEARHVRQCIRASLEKRRRPLDEDKVSQVMEDMQFKPDDSKLFSQFGCKKVEDKLSQVL